MRNGRPVYRVDVEGAKIDIRTLLSKDALRGAVPYGGMTHQEFLDMVTPNDVRGYAAFSNAEGITVAATSIALQWAVLKASMRSRKPRTRTSRRRPGRKSRKRSKRCGKRAARPGCPTNSARPRKVWCVPAGYSCPP